MRIWSSVMEAVIGANHWSSTHLIELVSLIELEAKYWEAGEGQQILTRPNVKP